LSYQRSPGQPGSCSAVRTVRTHRRASLLANHAVARVDSANAALAEVRIVAPDDTYQAAEMWATYYNPDLSRDPETHPSLPVLREKFLALAKRDMLA
jgi:hypothetical protein